MGWNLPCGLIVSEAKKIGHLTMGGLCRLRCLGASKSSTYTRQTPDPENVGFAGDLCLSRVVARGQVGHLMTSKMPLSFVLGNQITL